VEDKAGKRVLVLEGAVEATSMKEDRAEPRVRVAVQEMRETRMFSAMVCPAQGLGANLMVLVIDIIQVSTIAMMVDGIQVTMVILIFADLSRIIM
jgi:hypothetical protein